jgi:hypothetical protein
MAAALYGSFAEIYCVAVSGDLIIAFVDEHFG